MPVLAYLEKHCWNYNCSLQAVSMFHLILIHLKTKREEIQDLMFSLFACQLFHIILSDYKFERSIFLFDANVGNSKRLLLW